MGSSDFTPTVRSGRSHMSLPEPRSVVSFFPCFDKRENTWHVEARCGPCWEGGCPGTLCGLWEGGRSAGGVTGAQGRLVSLSRPVQAEAHGSEKIVGRSEAGKKIKFSIALNRGLGFNCNLALIFRMNGECTI